jgi:hypothetical protein
MKSASNENLTVAEYLDINVDVRTEVEMKDL